MTERALTPFEGRAAMTALKTWHAALAGAFIVAYVTAGEDFYAMHQFAGYGVLATIALRLLLGVLADGRGPLRLPRPLQAVRAWRERRAGRNPLFAMLAAALLATVGAVALSGATADFLPRLEDPHEAIAEASLWLIAGHVAFVFYMYGGRTRLAALLSRFDIHGRSPS